VIELKENWIKNNLESLEQMPLFLNQYIKAFGLKAEEEVALISSCIRKDSYTKGKLIFEMFLTNPKLKKSDRSWVAFGSAIDFISDEIKKTLEDPECAWYYRQHNITLYLKGTAYERKKKRDRVETLYGLLTFSEVWPMRNASISTYVDGRWDDRYMKIEFFANEEEESGWIHFDKLCNSFYRSEKRLMAFGNEIHSAKKEYSEQRVPYIFLCDPEYQSYKDRISELELELINVRVSMKERRAVILEEDSIYLDSLAEKVNSTLTDKERAEIHLLSKEGFPISGIPNVKSGLMVK